METHSLHQEMVYYRSEAERAWTAYISSYTCFPLIFPPYSRSLLLRRSLGSSSAVKPPCWVCHRDAKADRLMWEPSVQNSRSVSLLRSRLHHVHGGMSACLFPERHEGVRCATRPAPSFWPEIRTEHVFDNPKKSKWPLHSRASIV